MQTIVIDDRAVSVSLCVCHAAQLGFIVRGHSVQYLPNHLGLLLIIIFI